MSRARSALATYVALFAIIFATFAWGQSIPFPGPGMPAKGNPTVSYQSTATDNTAQTTYTFTSMACANPSATRNVVVGFMARTVAGTISSATIGGVSATISVQASSGGGANYVAGLLIAAVPTGTTCTVAVTLSSVGIRADSALWNTFDLNSITKLSSTSSTAAPLSLNLNTAAPDLIFAFASDNTTSTCTWVGVTKDVEATDAGGSSYSGGSFPAVSTETPRTISCTWGSSNTPVGVSAVYR